jgi:hypothetical protein
LERNHVEFGKKFKTPVEKISSEQISEKQRFLDTISAHHNGLTGLSKSGVGWECLQLG